MTRLSWVAVCVVAACGPIYPDKPAQQPVQQPQDPQGPPGGDQWSDPNNQATPAAPAGPSDPYAAEPAPPPQPPTPAPPPAPPQPDPWATKAPPPQPEPPPPPPRPEPPQPAGLSKDAAQILSAHNRYRADHCAAPMTWSPKLEQVAQAWANSLKADGCKFGHSGGQYGENLAAGTSGTLDGNAVAAMWYDEIKDYDFKSGGFSMQTGHFTQVVWKGTSSIGCGKATCRGMDIWVCNYDPPGNVDRGYRQNVAPKGCK